MPASSVRCSRNPGPQPTLRHLRVHVLLLLVALLAACPRGGTGSDSPNAVLGAPSAGADLGGASYVKSYQVEGSDLFVSNTSPTADGGQYLVGSVHARLPEDDSRLDSGGGRVAVLRTDPAGDVLWARVYDEAAPPGFMSAVVDASEAPDGGFWVAGERQGHARVLRLDADGQVQGAIDYGSDDSPVQLALVRATADGGFVAAGTVPGIAREARSASGGDLWLLQADRAGVQRRLQLLDGEPRAAEVPVDMRLGADGELTVVGSQGREYVKDDFWIAHFRSDLRLAFTETYTGITLSGEAQSLVPLPRMAGSNVAEAGVVAVGRSRGSRDGNGLGVATRSRLVYLALPGGEERQDDDLDVGAEDEANYAGVAAFRDANTIVAAGTRDVEVVPEDGGEARDLQRGFLQVLVRAAEGAAAGRFVSERILPLQDVAPTLPVNFLPARFEQARDGGYFLLGFSERAGTREFSVVALDAELRVRWIVDVRSLPRAAELAAVTRIVPMADGGVLLVSPAVLARLDASGSLRWARDLAAAPAPARLGPARAVTALSQGGVVAATVEGAVLRYAADGTLLFARQFEGASFIGTTELDRDGDGRGDALLLAGSQPDPRATDRPRTLLLRLALDGSVIDAQGLVGLAVDGSSAGISRSEGRLLLGLEDGMLWLDAAGRPVQRWRGFGVSDAAVATPDGAIARSPLAGDDDRTARAGVVARYGMDGRPRWARRFELLPSGIAAGSDEAAALEQPQLLRLHGLSVTSDGGVTVNGVVRRPSGGTCTSAEARKQVRIAGVSELGLASIRCSDGLLLRLDANGNLGWQSRFGTLRDDDLILGGDVADNGALAAGGTVGFAFPRASVFVARTDADGRVGSSCVASQPLGAALQASPVVVPAFSVLPVTADAAEVRVVDLPLDRSEPFSVTVARACSGGVASPLLQVAVTGDGRVAADPAEPLRAGIACPGDCTQRHGTGARVPLVALPSAGRAFVGWEGDCAGFGSQARITVTMDRDRSCTARFEARPTSNYGVAVQLQEPTSASGNRVFSLPDGVECTSHNAGTCSARFDTTTEVSLRAVAGPDQRFAGWTGCDVADTTSTPLCIVRGDRGDRQVTARFEQVAVLDLTVALAEPGGSRSNRVLSFPSGIDCTSGDSGQCNVRVREGTVTVALTPSAEAGQRFVGWLGCDSVSTATEPQCFVTVRAGSRNVTAQFEPAPDSYELRVVLEGRPQLDDDGSAATDRVRSNIGGILCSAASTACSARFTQGTEVRLTLELDPTLSRAGFRSRLDRWLECDLLEAVDVGQPPVCVIRQLNQDTEITARVGYIDDETFGGGAPVARVAITGQRAPEPNTVDDPAHFDARGSSTEAGRRIISYEWDWNADGAYDCAQTEADSAQCITTAILPFGVAEHQYTRRGVTTVGLRITDDVGRVRTLLRAFNVQ